MVLGILLRSSRGLELHVDGGGTWLLDVGPSAQTLVGRRVAVDGVRSGFDRLDVDRIDLV